MFGRKKPQQKVSTEKNPVDIYVGNRLKIRRISLGLSQKQISEMVGVTHQQINKYEKGINRIGSSRLYQFAKILMVPINYFFDGYEKSEHLDPINEELQKELAELTKHFINNDTKEKKAIINLAKSLALQEVGSE